MEECLPPYTMYIGQEVPKLMKSCKPFSQRVLFYWNHRQKWLLSPETEAISDRYSNRLMANLACYIC